MKRYSNYHRARKYFRRVMADLHVGWSDAEAERTGALYDKYRVQAARNHRQVGLWW
jgi:hypothetical protein